VNSRPAGNCQKLGDAGELRQTGYSGDSSTKESP
jgi:hypothetical protein